MYHLGYKDNYQMSYNLSKKELLDKNRVIH